MAGSGGPSERSRAGLGRWLACAFVLHAGGLLLMRASGSVSVPRAVPAAASVESEVDVSFDVGEPEPPPPVPSPEPSEAVSTERAVERRVRTAVPVPRTSTTPGGGSASDAAQGGLRTIANGTGVWPESIPHHLGRITGSRNGGVAVWGALSEAGLRRTVTEHSPGIRRCYDEGLSGAPSLAGRAIMRLMIERDGHVQRVNTLGSDLASKPVLRCLESLFQRMRFPRAGSDSVMVTYPLPLSPAQTPDWGVVP
jgi:hypothetical protein